MEKRNYLATTLALLLALTVTARYYTPDYLSQQNRGRHVSNRLLWQVRGAIGHV